MKRNDSRQGAITQPLLKDLMDRQKAESKENLQKVVVGSEPLQPSDLYQDSGSGYNRDFTFPQE
jgi:hypothetical protein